MHHWLRRLFRSNVRPVPGRPGVGAREADWLRRSTVPTEADEEARRRDEERRDPQGSPGASPP